MKLKVNLVLLTAMFLLSVHNSDAQEYNKKIIDPKLNTEILYGYCTRQGLYEGNFGRSFQDYYSVYKPDKKAVGEIRRNLDDASIVIVLGTWCSDSQEQVPKFFAILDKANFDESRLTLICVSRAKEAGEIDLSGYDIQRVPTFIIKKGDREIGRIIETPMNSLEKDLAMILGD